MFKNPLYIPPHTVDAFRGRVCNGLLSAKTIRKLIQYFAQVSEPVKYQTFNHKQQPIYKGDFDGIEFYIPVIEDKKKNGEWRVVPTILLPGMKFSYQKEQREAKAEKKQYYSAEALAREVKIDRTTISELINKGKIKALHHKKGDAYRIPLNEAEKFKKSYERPHDKWYKKWSETDIYILINNKGRTAAYVAGLLKRSARSVNVERCRLRKKGYDV